MGNSYISYFSSFYKMILNPKNKHKLDSYEDILCTYLNQGKKPTKAVEMALEQYNNSREENKGICLRTAWRKYKKVKEKWYTK